MSENLKALLDRINQEGIKQAEENKKAIEDKARLEAENTIKEAKRLADDIIHKAKEESGKLISKAELSVKQASRDLLLSLKEDIKKMLNKIVAGEVHKAMSSEETADIISDLIDKYVEKNGQAQDIKVLVKKDNLEKIKNSFLSRLKDKVKSGIEFKPSENINAGFSISFDRGRSFFDFTDEGLLETLCVYLNPELAKLIK